MKQKIKKLISFLEDNQLELESLVFNKGKLSFQVSDKLYEMVITATSGINQDDRHKWYQEEKAKLKDSPITQNLLTNLTKKYIEEYFLELGVIEKTQTTFDGETQVNIEDEKITDYKFDPLNFYGFRYNERGYFIKEIKDSNYRITSTFIMYPSNRESNSKTRWTFKRYTDKGIEIAFYGDLTFKSYEQVEQFFFRNGVIKCD